MTPRIANARMYAVATAAEAAWRALLGRVGDVAGVPLVYHPHPAPTPLEPLWARDDLGLVFMCGWPFANLYPAVQAIAAPVPVPAVAGGGPRYRTDIIARRDGPGTLGEALRGRLGWTVEHSQSGYHALRAHLGGRQPATWVGPLVTARRVVDSVLAGEIEAGPLDAYWHALLCTHAPDMAAGLRVLESTAPTPMPLFVGGPDLSADEIARLQAAFAALSDEPAMRSHLDALSLDGFAPVTRADYTPLISG